MHITFHTIHKLYSPVLWSLAGVIVVPCLVCIMLLFAILNLNIKSPLASVRHDVVTLTCNNKMRVRLIWDRVGVRVGHTHMACVFNTRLLERQCVYTRARQLQSPHRRRLPPSSSLRRSAALSKGGDSLIRIVQAGVAVEMGLFD